MLEHCLPPGLTSTTTPAGIAWHDPRAVLREITFSRRPRSETTVVCRRRIWESDCGRYRVVRAAPLFGPRSGRQAIPIVYYALLRAEQGWALVSVHSRGPQKTRHAAAVRACQAHAMAEEW